MVQKIEERLRPRPLAAPDQPPAMLARLRVNGADHL